MAVAKEAPVVVHLPDVDPFKGSIDDVVGAVDGFSSPECPITTVLCDLSAPPVAFDREEFRAVIDPGFVVGINLKFDRSF